LDNPYLVQCIEHHREFPYSVGRTGKFTADILLQLKKEKRLNRVNKELNLFGLNGKIRCKESTKMDGIFSVEIVKDNLVTNIVDNGFGLSQILPIITESIWMEQEGMLIIEQPEIHLNPKYQTKLADLLARIIENKKYIFLETHSEHLLLRLRTLIASNNSINSNQVNLIFIEPPGTEKSIKNIKIEKNGHISSENWPNDFFDDSIKESFNLAFEQSKDV
jgi:predicted ATPase